MSAPDKLEALLERYGYGDADEESRNRFLVHGLAQVEAAQERRRKFAEFVSEGNSIANTCRLMGMSRKTYELWRRDHPEFRDLIDDIRNSRGKKKPEEATDGWDGQFMSFRKRFFNFDTYWHQKQIVHAIESAQPGEIVMILCPPEHGKTTTLEDYINYKLAVNPNFRITYVHESMNFARRVLRRVSQRMRDVDQFPEYVTRFGPFYKEGQEKLGKPWTADQLTVANAQHDERDYSLQVRGWTSSVQGTRTDLLLLDDVQALKSLNQTERLAQTLRQDYFSRPGAKGRIVMVGTRVGQGDIYQHFLEDEGLSELIKLVQLPALDGDGKPLCPEMWDEKSLKLKRKLVGEEAWWRNYQQNPLASGSQTFSTEMIANAKDPEIPVCAVKPAEPVILGLDPALAGQNALIAASYTRDKLNLVDLRSEEGLARVENIIDGIADFAIRYRPQDVVIETMAFQQGLARDERLIRLSKMHGFRIREHLTYKQKTDPILGVASMASAFLREEIRIPWGSQLAEARFAKLVAELISWRPDIPTKHLRQDNVMALWFVWKFWMETRQAMGFNTANFDFGGIPWRQQE